MYNYGCKGLRQVQTYKTVLYLTKTFVVMVTMKVFVRYKTDEDLCGRNVVLLQSTVLSDMLHITTDTNGYSRSHERHHIICVTACSVQIDQ